MTTTAEIAKEEKVAAGVDVSGALGRAREALLGKHMHGGLGGSVGGYWCGELQGDSILQSEYILLKWILGQESDPDLPLIANYLRMQQQADGGWNMYPGGANDLSGTVKGYFALKLMGDDAEAPHMLRAKAQVLRMGGAEKVNSFSKFYLAALGQVSYEACPTIPPEIVLLPKWLYFNLYGVSAWSRTMILPLAIVTTLRPVRKLGEGQGCQELIVDKVAANGPMGRWLNMPRSWREMFLLIDLSMKKFEKTVTMPVRGKALKEAERWILEHMEGSEGLGAIFPPMVYVLIVFKALGYAEDHPRVVEAQRQLKDLFIRERMGEDGGRNTKIRSDEGPRRDGGVEDDDDDDDVNTKIRRDEGPRRHGGEGGDDDDDARVCELRRPVAPAMPVAPGEHMATAVATAMPTGASAPLLDTIRIQPCFSPVWDTGIAMHALAEAGLEEGHAAAVETVEWLLSKECRKAGDWQKNCEPVEASGWYFEYENPHYPDSDDTAMVCIALKRLGGAKCEGAIKRGVKWLLAMQNDDGGWAAFDRTRNRSLLEHVPFADHNAIQDPSCPDITGRVLEGLGRCGVTTGHPAVRRAIGFIRQTQDGEGCWFGRWGVNYIYGTWQVLMGLKAVGENMEHKYVQRAGAWLRGCQKEDGSWGESCDSYEEPGLKGKGESTPSQTAWGVMGLMATAGAEDAGVHRAMAWLVEKQLENGSWEEEPYTGTGFPRVFYLKYHLYRLYFPLMALGRYARKD